jgi:predicted  nucleic acid-binding Zn-ribbon protein
LFCATKREQETTELRDTLKQKETEMAQLIKQLSNLKQELQNVKSSQKLEVSRELQRIRSVSEQREKEITKLKTELQFKEREILELQSSKSHERNELRGSAVLFGLFVCFKLILSSFNCYFDLFL